MIALLNVAMRSLFVFVRSLRAAFESAGFEMLAPADSEVAPNFCGLLGCPGNVDVVTGPEAVSQP